MEGRLLARKPSMIDFGLFDVEEIVSGLSYNCICSLRMGEIMSGTRSLSSVVFDRLVFMLNDIRLPNDLTLEIPFLIDSLIEPLLACVR